MKRNDIIKINFSNFQVINYDTLRGGISIDTRKGDVTTSHLLIQNADESNTGKYSCSPSNAIVANIRVHVLNGKFELHAQSSWIIWHFRALSFQVNILRQCIASARPCHLKLQLLFSLFYSLCRLQGAQASVLSSQCRPDKKPNEAKHSSDKNFAVNTQKSL